MSGLTWMSALPGRSLGDHGTGRLAIDCVFDTGWAAVFWGKGTLIFQAEDRYGRP